jgi:Domain of unknown function (DUF4864)
MTPFARLIGVLIVAAGFSLPAMAEDVAAGDAATIRSMIQSQIDAFQHDDGSAAYGYASPGIKGMFPSPDIFMDMVRKLYPPVYRPQSVTFGPIAQSQSGPMQKVFLVGPDGKSYVAVYTLERQPDGSWKISGCYIVPDEGATI